MRSASATLLRCYPLSKIDFDEGIKAWGAAVISRAMLDILIYRSAVAVADSALHWGRLSKHLPYFARQCSSVGASAYGGSPSSSGAVAVPESDCSFIFDGGYPNDEV